MSTMDERLIAAEVALSSHDKYQGYRQEVDEGDIIDLMTDLLHLAVHCEYNPEQILSSVRLHFEAEHI